MARSGDTKLLCHVAQMIIALSGVSLWPLSGGKSLDVHFVNPSSVFLLDKGSNWSACSRVTSRSMSLLALQEYSHAHAFCVAREVNGR